MLRHGEVKSRIGGNGKFGKEGVPRWNAFQGTPPCVVNAAGVVSRRGEIGGLIKWALPEVENLWEAA